MTRISGTQSNIKQKLNMTFESVSVKRTQVDSVGSIPLQAQLPTPQVPSPLSRVFYEQFLSIASRSATSNAIRKLEPYEKIPGTLTLLAGKPNVSTFPMTSLQFTMRSPMDHSKEEVISLTGQKMEQALQYGPTTGVPSLINWLAGLQKSSHKRVMGEKEGWRLSVGNGSQDVLYKATHSLLNPGDYVLLETPVYAPFIPILERLKCNIVAVDSDTKGIKPSSLKEVLENWPESRPKPKILYTVPYGCNPSGATSPTERRREILSLARKHNFLIFEDDPYYYLYFGTSPRPASYFELETEQSELGRVIRFDSLSKIVSSGFRIGFASGPIPIMEAIDSHTSISNLQASTLTQVITDAMFQAWGYDGFSAHVASVASFYRRRKETFESYMHAHLDGLAEWTSPDAGMFLWVKLLIQPSSSDTNDGDSETILPIAVEKGILPLPGAAFMADRRKTPYIRLSYSQLSDDQVEEAVRRLAETVREARGRSQISLV